MRMVHCNYECRGNLFFYDVQLCTTIGRFPNRIVHLPIQVQNQKVGKFHTFDQLFFSNNPTRESKFLGKFKCGLSKYTPIFLQEHMYFHRKTLQAEISSDFPHQGSENVDVLLVVNPQCFAVVY